jgi:hypothetical protein
MILVSFIGAVQSLNPLTIAHERPKVLDGVGEI